MTNLSEKAAKLISKSFYSEASSLEHDAYKSGVLDMLKIILEEKSWDNPYTKAIAELERASRAFEGSYG